jgi:hypothetical protein
VFRGVLQAGYQLKCSFSALRLEELFFAKYTVRGFNPQEVQENPLVVLMHLASPWPRGVHTASFLRIIRRCYKCDNFVFTDNRGQHTCCTQPNKVEPLPVDFDIVHHLTKQGSTGFSSFEFLQVLRRCSLCDRIFCQNETTRKHSCRFAWGMGS